MGSSPQIWCFPSAVARAEGARFGDDVVDGTVEMFRQAPTDMGTSMRADREAAAGRSRDIRTPGDHPQGTRPRNRDADQRCAGALASRGQRRSGLAVLTTDVGDGVAW
jgi:hypothetical protein